MCLGHVMDRETYKDREDGYQQRTMSDRQTAQRWFLSELFAVLEIFCSLGDTFAVDTSMKLWDFSCFRPAHRDRAVSYSKLILD